MSALSGVVLHSRIPLHVSFSQDATSGLRRGRWSAVVLAKEDR